MYQGARRRTLIAVDERNSRLRDALIAVAVFTVVIVVIVLAGKIARSTDRPPPYDKGAAFPALRG
jgi:hypothetical protein